MEERIIFQAPKGTKKRLDSAAAKNNRSRSKEILTAVEEHLSPAKEEKSK